jgi:hypothetical protein
MAVKHALGPMAAVAADVLLLSGVGPEDERGEEVDCVAEPVGGGY